MSPIKSIVWGQVGHINAAVVCHERKEKVPHLNQLRIGSKFRYDPIAEFLPFTCKASTVFGAHHSRFGAFGRQGVVQIKLHLALNATYLQSGSSCCTQELVKARTRAIRIASFLCSWGGSSENGISSGWVFFRPSFTGPYSHPACSLARTHCSCCAPGF